MYNVCNYSHYPKQRDLKISDLSGFVPGVPYMYSHTLTESLQEKQTFHIDASLYTQLLLPFIGYSGMKYKMMQQNHFQLLTWAFPTS